MTSEITKNLENTNINEHDLLVTEKDFVDLSVFSVAKIKEANKPTKFTMSYIKQNLEDLSGIIETNRVDELLRNLTTLFNKKRKEESEKYGKKPKSKTPTIQAGNAIDSAASKGKLDVYDDDDYYSEEEEY